VGGARSHPFGVYGSIRGSSRAFPSLVVRTNRPLAIPPQIRVKLNLDAAIDPSNVSNTIHWMHALDTSPLAVRSLLAPNHFSLLISFPRPMLRYFAADLSILYPVSS
jgi:hypothetical protein